MNLAEELGLNVIQGPFVRKEGKCPSCGNTISFATNAPDREYVPVCHDCEAEVYRNLPKLVSQCCGRPATDEVEFTDDGESTGRCSGCLEGAMFEPEPEDHTCAECGRPLSDGEEEKCSQCASIAYAGGV